MSINYVTLKADDPGGSIATALPILRAMVVTRPTKLRLIKEADVLTDLGVSEAVNLINKLETNFNPVLIRIFRSEGLNFADPDVVKRVKNLATQNKLTIAQKDYLVSKSVITREKYPNLTRFDLESVRAV